MMVANRRRNVTVLGNSHDASVVTEEDPTCAHMYFIMLAASSGKRNGLASVRVSV